MIPARYAATRFPGKLMQKLGNKSVILRTYEATVATGLFDTIIVVTDSDLIFKEINSQGGTAIMSKKVHESGTDRIAEAAIDIACDIIVNVQGDEPFVKKEPLQKLLQQFDDTTVEVASLMQELKSEKQVMDPDYVKVAIDKNKNSLFFSRSVIPYRREKNISIPYYEHIGVYAFRKQALLSFANWPVSQLEAAEKIECLRFLENGMSIRMVLTDYMGVEIDTPEDLKRAERFLQIPSVLPSEEN